MSDDSLSWFRYAFENLAVARLAFEAGYYNACLQNVQQSIEKYFKAMLDERGMGIEKTHNIGHLQQKLTSSGFSTILNDDECDLLDSIYIPSKYPTGNALPDFIPDQSVCETCLAMGEKVKSAFHERNKE